MSSLSNGILSSECKSEVEELSCFEDEDKRSEVDELMRWVETDAKFKGRKDRDFLLLFVRSCDFDLELSKTTMELYYQNRVRFPLWWTNRDVTHPQIQSVFRSNLIILLRNKSVDQPAIAFTRVSKYGNDASIVDDVIKCFSITLELGMRRANFQLRGGVAITDVANCPSWAIMYFAWPTHARNLLNAFFNSLPGKFKACVFINCTPLLLALVRTIKYVVPQSIMHKVHFFGSDWSDISRVLPLELLPVEYGGSAGPIKQHEDEFMSDLCSFNEYLVDDNKYDHPFD